MEVKMRFKVQKEAFEKLDGLFFGVVVAKGVDNTKKIPQTGEELNRSINYTREKLKDVNLREYPAIALYRDAFLKLDINPNKYMCSIEALLKRVMKGGEFPQINPVVDISNAVSLKYVIPLGAHDIDRFDGDIEVRFSRDGDTFLPFGSTEDENVELGELVYASGGRVKTRKWIWRQSDEGKIEEGSSNIFFPLDGFAQRKDEVLAACGELAGVMQSLFGAQVKTGFVDAQNPSFEI